MADAARRVCELRSVFDQKALLAHELVGLDGKDPLLRQWRRARRLFLARLLFLRPVGKLRLKLLAKDLIERGLRLFRTFLLEPLGLELLKLNSLLVLLAFLCELLHRELLLEFRRARALHGDGRQPRSHLELSFQAIPIYRTALVLIPPEPNVTFSLLFVVPPRPSAQA